MTKELSEAKKLKDARTAARRKVEKICPHQIKGNVVCCLDQYTLNISLHNLAILSKSSHSRVQAMLRHYKIPKGKASKKFIMKLRSEGLLEIIYPIKKQRFIGVGEVEHHIIKQDVIAGFKM